MDSHPVNPPAINKDDPFTYTQEKDNEFASSRKMKRIYNLLSNLDFSSKIGQPLCFTVGGNFAIGTNLGYIIISDFSGEVKVILGKLTPYYGLVTSLSFSADYTRLLAGYSQGFIIVWSWESAKIIFLIKPSIPNPNVISSSVPSDSFQLKNNNPINFHSPDVPITHLSFIGISRHRFISGDSSGRLIHHQIIETVVFSKLKSKLLLDSSESEDSKSTLLDLEVLPYLEDHPSINKLGLVAILLNDRLLVFKTQPDFSTVLQIRYLKPYTPNSPPGSISWSPGSNINGMEILPTLALANGCSISLYYLKYSLSNDEISQISLINFFDWKSTSDVLLVQWIEPTIFSFIDANNSIYSVDFCSRVETKVYSFSSTNIISQPWVSIRLGIDLKGSLRYSLIQQNKKIFILSDRCITLFLFKTWSERIVWLMDEGRFVEAVALCTGLYKGDSGQIALGLPYTLSDLLLSNPPITFDRQILSTNSQLNPDIQRHSLVGPKLTSLVQASLKFVFSAKYTELSNPISRNSRFSNEHLYRIYNGLSIDGVLRSLLVVCIEACIATDQLKFLFNDTFEQVRTFPNAELIFLEVLEPFIENGIIKSVSPMVLQSLVKSYSEDELKRKKLEECLLYINLSPNSDGIEIDVDGLLSTCSMWKMWKALFRIWIDILHDPTKPASDMFIYLDSFINEFSLSNSPDSLMDDSWTSKFHVLSYETSVLFPVLENVLCGLSYPTGVPFSSNSQAVSMASSTLSFLTNPLHPETPNTNIYSVFYPGKAINYNINSNSNSNSNSSVSVAFEAPFSPNNPCSINGGDLNNTSIYSKSNYKYLEILLTVNTKKTLSIFNAVFNCPFSKKLVIQLLQAKNKSQQSSPNSGRVYKGAKSSKQAIQVVCDSLLRVLQFHYDLIKPIEKSSKSLRTSLKCFNLGRERISLLASFLARTYSSNYPLVYFPEGTTMYLAEILFVTKTDITSHECESALEQLLKIVSPFPEVSSLIEYATYAKYYRVLGTLYSSTGQLDFFLESFLDDPNDQRRSSLFSQVKSLLEKGSNQFSIVQINSLQQSFIKNAVRLAHISVFNLAIFVESQIIQDLEHPQIISSLNEDPKYGQYQFLYLQILFDFNGYIKRNLLHDLDAASHLNVKTHESSINHLYTTSELQESSDTYNSVYKYKGESLKITFGCLAGAYSIDPDRRNTFCERFIIMLAKVSKLEGLEFSPFLEYIKLHYSNGLPDANPIVSIERVEEICKNMEISEAIIWLYLQQNDYQNALYYCLNELKKIEFNTLEASYHNDDIFSSKKLITTKIDISESSSQSRLELEFSTNRKNSLNAGDINYALQKKYEISKNDQPSLDITGKLNSITEGCLFICKSASAPYIRNTEDYKARVSTPISDSNEILQPQFEDLWLEAIFTYVSLMFPDSLQTMNSNENLNLYFDSPDSCINIAFNDSIPNKYMEVLCHNCIKIVDSFAQYSLKCHLPSSVAAVLKKFLFKEPEIPLNLTNLNHPGPNVSSKKPTPELTLTSLSYRFKFLAVEISSIFSKKKSLLSLISKILNLDLFNLVMKHYVFSKNGFRLTAPNINKPIKFNDIATFGDNSPHPSQTFVIDENQFQNHFPHKPQSRPAKSIWDCNICSLPLFRDDRRETALKRFSTISKIYYTQINLLKLKDIVTKTSPNSQSNTWRIVKHQNNQVRKIYHQGLKKLSNYSELNKTNLNNAFTSDSNSTEVKNFDKNSKKVVIFACGHGFHLSCLEKLHPNSYDHLVNSYCHICK
ncbi:Vacuolar protein sorting-associated protein 8-like protein [Smittium mucronatum]|uniref:Vacuolar protein sorting-associated protein 8-like protein n=1 Tax=Smittium mucronatum TaxID=133383 RepID=A0A1R0H741_9FUNG|nr:Vacuolar protein sorting-associated protein 8-like protein [Smittium mucronatum]